MDTPSRANAAQLAARSIKAKPKGRLTNQKGGFAPVQNNNPNNNPPPAAGGGGGGLFGGSISASGSFDFSTPVGASGFNASFGGSIPNPFAQSAASANEDPRADTTGEEAKRREKGFRAAGEDEEALFAAHSPYHHNQPSNAFGSSNNTQPQNLFGAANATQSNGVGLSFGSSMSQNQTANSNVGGFNFTPTSQATNSNSNPTFAFGSSSQAPMNNSTPVFSFGGANSGQAEKPLNFGADTSSQAQNSLTLESQKASNFSFDPSSIVNSNVSSQTAFATNQFGNSNLDQHFSTGQHDDAMLDQPFSTDQFDNAMPDQQSSYEQPSYEHLFYPNEDTETMSGQHKVEYPAAQAPVRTSQIQYPMGHLGFNDMRYHGSFPSPITGSIFSYNPSMEAVNANCSSHIQETSSTSFGQNNTSSSFGQSNTNNSFGAQNNSFGGSFGGSFGNQANTSFTGLNSTNIAPTNSQSMFGNTTAATSAPPSSSAFPPSFPTTTSASSTSNLFGNPASSFPTAAAPSTTSFFGNVNSSFPPATASSTPLFGAAKPTDSTTPASSTPLFGGVKPAESTTSTSSTSLFGGIKPADSTPSASGNSLFGGSKLADSAPSSSSTSNMFAKPSATPATSFTGFGKSAESTPNIFKPSNQNNGQSNNLFGSKPTEESKDKQTPDLFNNLNRPIGQQASEPNAIESTAEKTPAKTPNALFDGFGKATPPGQHQLGGAAKEPSFATSSNSQAGSSFKIRGNAEASGFNKSSPFKPTNTPADAAQSSSSNTLGVFSSQPTQTFNGSPNNSSGSGSLALSAPANSFAKSSALVNNSLALGKISDFEFQLSEPTKLEMEENFPRNIDADKKNQFQALWRITSLNKSMAAYFQHLPPGADAAKGLAWFEAKKMSILAEHKIDYISNKRGRTESEIENDENQENMSPSKRFRPDRERSQRVPSPEKRSRNTQSPEKRPRATNEFEPQLNGNSILKAPKLQYDRSSSPSKSSSRSAALEPTSSKKRRSETQMESGDGDSGANKKRKPEQSSHNEGAESGGSKKRKPELYLTQNDPEGIEDGKNSNKKISNGSSSSTSTMFANILDSQDKSLRSVSPERKTRPLPGAVKEAVSVPVKAPLANPFGTLPGASPIKSNTATTSTTPSKPPVFKFTPTSTTPTTSPTKPPTFIGASTGGIKPPTFAGAPTGGIKPPTFGSGPANFMAQFGKQAAESAEENEKKLMQKAKDEDFDSEDDDEAEWEANYKKKRAAELKKLAELAKGKAPSFLVKPTESAKSTESKETSKPAATNIFAPVATTTSTPLFGQSKPVTGSTESVLSSANASRTSTPNIFSGTGSVLGSAASASGKTPSFAGNPFAHLSDADSNNQNDGDDESSDNGSDDEGERKDPSYKPNTSNGTSTPSTPIDETGSGIASVKKSVTEPAKLNLFGSTASSGTTTSTPGTGGSLLSRMTRDPVPEEKEKENSTPKSTTNMFGSSFSAASGTPADKTWKPDTPIKFGSAAPSAPTFNITGSTPTKPGANIFGGLFGNSGTSTPALSSGPTTTTGFQFGGPASATSSLFPSVAASADTSRTTSPGATTDGATDADDNDPEKVHAQVNLLDSNPGEENEDVIHSVRARALKFCPKEEGDEKSSPWDTKGVGPLKVLRHKETKATRIVLRSDPSGSIILNKSLLSQVKYEANGKTIKLMTVGDDGKGLQTWLLQLKETDLAEDLAKCLEENKANNN